LAISKGFTLLELLVVIAVIALGTAGVALAMRDTGQTQLEREAVRLAALLDAARGQSRAAGQVVTWQATVDDQGVPHMRWTGLRHKEPLPTTWLSPQIKVTYTDSVQTSRLVLGPDPVITPIRLQLMLGSDSKTVASDGVESFAVQ
jgi:general secretion pathway protein H